MNAYKKWFQKNVMKFLDRPCDNQFAQENRTEKASPKKKSFSFWPFKKRSSLKHEETTDDFVFVTFSTPPQNDYSLLEYKVGVYTKFCGIPDADLDLSLLPQQAYEENDLSFDRQMSAQLIRCDIHPSPRKLESSIENIYIELEPFEHPPRETLIRQTDSINELSYVANNELKKLKTMKIYDATATNRSVNSHTILTETEIGTSGVPTLFSTSGSSLSRTLQYNLFLNDISTISLIQTENNVTNLPKETSVQHQQEKHQKELQKLSERDNILKNSKENIIQSLDNLSILSDNSDRMRRILRKNWKRTNRIISNMMKDYEPPNENINSHGSASSTKPVASNVSVSSDISYILMSDRFCADKSNNIISSTLRNEDKTTKHATPSSEVSSKRILDETYVIPPKEITSAKPYVIAVLKKQNVVNNQNSPTEMVWYPDQNVPSSSKKVIKKNSINDGAGPSNKISRNFEERNNTSRLSNKTIRNSRRASKQ